MGLCLCLFSDFDRVSIEDGSMNKPLPFELRCTHYECPTTNFRKSQDINSVLRSLFCTKYSKHYILHFCKFYQANHGLFLCTIISHLLSRTIFSCQFFFDKRNFCGAKQLWGVCKLIRLSVYSRASNVGVISPQLKIGHVTLSALFFILYFLIYSPQVKNVRFLMINGTVVVPPVMERKLIFSQLSAGSQFALKNITRIYFKSQYLYFFSYGLSLLLIHYAGLQPCLVLCRIINMFIKLQYIENNQIYKYLPMFLINSP